MKTDSKSQQIPQLQSLFFFLDIIPFSYFSTSFTFHHSIFVRFLEIIHSSFSFHSLPSVRKKLAKEIFEKTHKRNKTTNSKILNKPISLLLQPSLSLLFLFVLLAAKSLFLSFSCLVTKNNACQTKKMQLNELNY